MRPLKAPARWLRGVIGYELVIRTSAPPAPAPAPTPFDTPTDAVYARADVVFEVPTSKCYFSHNFSHGTEGWHPFVKTLVEYGAGRQTRYEGSILKQYYETFQPRTHLDLFLGHLEKDPARLAPPLNLGAYVPVLPWAPFVRRPPKGEKGLDASHGTQAYGPVSEIKGRLEFARLTSTYDSIRREGYRPTCGPDGDVEGYFLKGWDDYRFVVRAGFHRMAALAALGYDPARVKFYPHYPRMIDVKDLESWPQVKAGVVAARVAEAIFLTFFGDGGVAWAREHGLYRADPREPGPVTVPE